MENFYEFVIVVTLPPKHLKTCTEWKEVSIFETILVNYLDDRYHSHNYVKMDETFFTTYQWKMAALCMLDLSQDLSWTKNHDGRDPKLI